MFTIFRFPMKKSGTRSRESTGRARKKDSKPTTALISLIRAKNHQIEENHDHVLSDLLQRTAEPTITRSSVLESLIPTDPVIDNPERQNSVSCELGPPTTGKCDTLSAATASNIQVNVNVNVQPLSIAAAAVSVAPSVVKYSYFADSPGATCSSEDMTVELARIDREVLLAKKVRLVCCYLPDIEIRMIACKC
jgi:hypothetical protein